MSLRLLVDEDTQEKLLVDLLKKAGHDVVTVNELKLQGSDDIVVFNRAITEKRVLLTKNCRDFKKLLDEKNPKHPGILGIYQDKDPYKNMRNKDIVKIISKMEMKLISIEDKFTSLIKYKYLLNDAT